MKIGIYTGVLGTSLLLYWGNAQFANYVKAEVVIWIAALSGALEWMANAEVHFNHGDPKASIPHTLGKDSETKIGVKRIGSTSLRVRTYKF
jgi:hypothetical protein